MRQWRTICQAIILEGSTSDKDKIVRNTALLMLTKQNKSSSTLSAVLSNLENGSLTSENYHMILTLVNENYRKYPDLSKQILTLMLEKGVGNKGIRKQIYAMLKRLG